MFHFDTSCHRESEREENGGILKMSVFQGFSFWLVAEISKYCEAHIRVLQFPFHWHR